MEIFPPPGRTVVLKHVPMKNLKNTLKLKTKLTKIKQKNMKIKYFDNINGIVI